MDRRELQKLCSTGCEHGVKLGRPPTKALTFKRHQAPPAHGDTRASMTPTVLHVASRCRLRAGVRARALWEMRMRSETWPPPPSRSYLLRLALLGRPSTSTSSALHSFMLIRPCHRSQNFEVRNASSRTVSVQCKSLVPQVPGLLSEVKPQIHAVLKTCHLVTPSQLASVLLSKGFKKELIRLASS